MPPETGYEDAFARLQVSLDNLAALTALTKANDRPQEIEPFGPPNPRVQQLDDDDQDDYIARQYREGWLVRDKGGGRP